MCGAFAIFVVIGGVRHDCKVQQLSEDWYEIVFCYSLFCGVVSWCAHRQTHMRTHIQTHTHTHTYRHTGTTVE